MQHQILQKDPTADLKVYAVWFNMYPGDARWRWDGESLILIGAKELRFRLQTN